MKRLLCRVLGRKIRTGVVDAPAGYTTAGCVRCGRPVIDPVPWKTSTTPPDLTFTSTMHHVDAGGHSARISRRWEGSE